MRTKIVCTLGPASDSESVLRDMVRSGMDVARINFSHGTHAEHARRIDLVRRVAREEGALLAIMGDLQGPKFRVGDLPAGGISLVPGSELIFAARLDQPASASSASGVPVIPLPHDNLISVLRPGQRILIDDGAMELLVIEPPSSGSIRCRVVAGGALTSHKGVAAPGVKLDVSSITDKDRADAEFAVAQKLDALALSFVRTAADIRSLRAIINELGGDQFIVAKIEKPEAVLDLANILREVDVIMVARGDLGVEAPAEEVPFYQKKIIQSCLNAGVPVITATQMLQSMITSPRPTRAEASDVANAVLDGTDAVMLSAETAAGEYPVDSVKAIERIAARAELDCHAGAHASGNTQFGIVGHMPTPDATTQAITRAAVEIAEAVGAKVIVCMTSTGFTARMVSRHRPCTPIIAMTSGHRAYQFTAFMWDVRAIEVPEFATQSEMFDAARELALRYGYAQAGDQIVITAGVPRKSGQGTTDLVKVHLI